MSHILIVDDSPSMRKLVSDTLERAGYSVSQAIDGVEALTAAKSTNFDLVITDVNMPNMDGITLVGELRALTNMRFTPILLLTTEIDTVKKKSAKEKGATGWLNKPFNEEKMLSTVSRVLN